MAQPTPGSNYTVQQGDTLFSIARQAYGDAIEEKPPLLRVAPMSYPDQTMRRDKKATAYA